MQMGSRFTRNIHNIRKIDNQDFRTNVQNDLLSDTDGEVYVRTKEKEKPQYYQLTDAVKSVNGVAPTDRTGAITIPTGGREIQLYLHDWVQNQLQFFFTGDISEKYNMKYLDDNGQEFTFDKQYMKEEDLTYYNWMMPEENFVPQRQFNVYLVDPKNNNKIMWQKIFNRPDLGETDTKNPSFIYGQTYTNPVKIQVSKDSKNLQIWFYGNYSDSRQYRMIFSGLNPETDAPLALEPQYQSNVNQTMFLATVPDNYNTMLYCSLYDVTLGTEGVVLWTGTVLPPTMLP